MTEQPTAGRDVLAELDSINGYLLGLIGDEPKEGQESNRRDLASRMVHLRNLAQNIVELAAEYASGVSHEERMRRSTGQPLTADQSELDRLRERVRELEGSA